jgi:aspartyl-tRNA(Asn)/glutamyl-tRNA(Gln) amidotransferase subunit B
MPTSILSRYPDYETTIGIEVHVQLNTKSKIFCSCLNKVSKEPNVNICNICTAQPGSLPVLNKKVVDYAILLGLATKSAIAKISSFSRKHYFYPDLPKNYQITQHTQPICTEGSIPIVLDDGTIKHIRLIRIHMEEDAGKNIHVTESNESLVNLNRAGAPLLEIVTYPDISNAYEAKAYLQALHLLVRYLGISTGNMEEGAFRADTNISVKKKSERELGTRCELKNINSFKFISDAIEYELTRQLELVSQQQAVHQETRLWDPQLQKTLVMRSKEEAADYRYVPDPDLPLVQVSGEWKKRMESLLIELPFDKQTRLIKEGLSAYQAEIITSDLELSAYYDQARSYTKSPLLINWILRDIMALLKEQNIPLSQCRITPELLAELVDLVDQDIINTKSAQQVFTIIAQTGTHPTKIVHQEGLEQVGSKDELEAIVVEIIESNPQQVAAYKSGKNKLFGFFVGQAMSKTGGKANPKIIQELFKKRLV